MSWATVWRTLIREDALRTQIKTDPHSPGVNRAIQPLKNIDAGELVALDGKLLVGCREGTIEVLELQMPGKKRMSAIDFINSNKVEGAFG